MPNQYLEYYTNKKALIKEHVFTKIRIVKHQLRSKAEHFLFKNFTRQGRKR